MRGFKVQGQTEAGGSTGGQGGAVSEAEGNEREQSIKEVKETVGFQKKEAVSCRYCPREVVRMSLYFPHLLPAEPATEHIAAPPGQR